MVPETGNEALLQLETLIEGLFRLFDQSFPGMLGKELDGGEPVEALLLRASQMFVLSAGLGDQRVRIGAGGSAEDGRSVVCLLLDFGRLLSGGSKKLGGFCPGGLQNRCCLLFAGGLDAFGLSKSLGDALAKLRRLI